MNAAERFHQVRPFGAGLALLATHIIACGQGFVTSFGGPGAQDGVGVIQQGSEFWVASREFNTEEQKFQADLYRRNSRPGFVLTAHRSSWNTLLSRIPFGQR